MCVQRKQGLSQLDKKIIGTLLIALSVLVFAVSLSYVLFGQSNQTNDTVPNSPSPKPTPTPEPTSTLTSSVTTTTYGGTTLVCNGSLRLGNDGGPVFIINYVDIKNIGTATAYRVKLRIDAYYPDGTLAAVVTKTLDASGIYSPFPGYTPVPVTIEPGQTVSFPNSGRDGAYEIHGQIPDDVSILGNYTITPVWSSTP
jgi:hypothetical protein